MARIKINDLPKDMKISKEDMRKITGGTLQEQFEETSSIQVSIGSSPINGFTLALEAANTKLRSAGDSLAEAKARVDAETTETIYRET